MQQESNNMPIKNSAFNLLLIATRLVLFIGIFSISISSFAQFERFKSYNATDGICDPYIYTITQDKNGFIWLGTGQGLCRFDGFEFKSFADLDSLTNDEVSASYVDSFGNVWFGFSNGLLLLWDGHKGTTYNLPTKSSTAIVGITQAENGELFVATLNMGCYLVAADGSVRSAHEEFTDNIISDALISNGNLFIGTGDGLQIIPIEGNRFNFSSVIKPEGLKHISVQVIKKAGWDNFYFIGTEDEGLFLLNMNDNSMPIVKVGDGTDLGYQNVQDVIFLSDNSLWICTYYGGLIKLSGFNEDGTFSNKFSFTKDRGLSTNYIKTIFSDREDNLWIGTYGSGINILSEQAFTFMPFEKEILDNNVLSVTSSDSIVWIAGEGSLVQVNINHSDREKVYTTKDNLPKDKITSLSHVGDVTWIGTENNGIYKLDISKGKIKSFYRSNNSLGNSINSILGHDDMLYAATKDGIYNFDLKTGEQFHYNTSVGMPHNDIEHIFLDNEHRLLFATRSNGVYEINDKGEIQGIFTVDQFEPEFNSITQDANKNIWVSTYGQGVFLLTADSVYDFSTYNGLKSPWCYSVSTNDDDFVWVGHRGGLSRININTHAIKIFDSNIGFEGYCNPNAVDVNNKRKIFFGTTDGLLIYDVEKGKNEAVPPKTNILKLLINEVEYNFDDKIVLPYAPYKLRIEYVGLNYNDPSAVKYQYMLEGYDMEWSEVSDSRYNIYSRVEDGKFKFKVRSFGPDGQYEEEPVSFLLEIKPPIWKRWWFISLVVIAFIFIVIFIIKYRERRQKEIQEYLEKSLDERTREVVEQKEEIEIKNRDITDSINYAQRIQNSILPPIKKMQQFFSGSFIFYKPRDIVSGDFYWFDSVAEGKIIIVCADSTGHGVPGAFMSMIGTTLIKDICLSNRYDSPAAILSELDKQLGNTLNQNSEEVKSNDGMDLMLCEIDVNTKILRYSSAMRPMIIYKNGEQEYIKGSRSSIGGQYDSKDVKDFETHEIQLAKGDLVYLFSDGYPDQFGGSMGKKFKMVRLKNLIKDIHKKPMEEQYEYVKSTFNLWKEDYDQVDDVLFMGIKL